MVQASPSATEVPWVILVQSLSLSPINLRVIVAGGNEREECYVLYPGHLKESWCINKMK